jgi:hypothetical protein
LSTTNPPTFFFFFVWQEDLQERARRRKKKKPSETEDEEDQNIIKIKNQGFGFSLWVCRLQKMCLYVVDGNSDSRGCDQFVLIKILPTCPTRFEELLLLLLLWFGDRASA